MPPLWKDLVRPRRRPKEGRERRLRRPRAAAHSVASTLTGTSPGAALQQLVEPRFGLAIVAAVGALAAFGVGESGFADLRAAGLDHKLAAVGAGAAFVLLGSFAVRRFANQLGLLVSARGGRSAGAAVRLVATCAGLLVVLILALGLLRIPVAQLLLGGAITGVILGIAAQQSLGNVFAGIVLLLARPFAVGSSIRLHSGSLGGPFEGEVVAVDLTYVVLEVDGLEMRVPNLQMLAAAVVRLPPRDDVARRALYVNRSLPRRPPRSTWQHQARSTVPRRTRRPRELVRRMRDRAAAAPPQAADRRPASATDEANSPGRPADRPPDALN